ncbi:transposase [Empedobacter falsenii]|uniref:transposase n=1 Tax=Empedobacter falsenii TaxID=343874 RepID=UPI002575E993|nr:transposase [Empedobacter falsenii]MDM1549540.1 transposase [Empedobacter falsenii]
MRNFKDIHIGKLIYLAVKEGDIEKTRIVNFFKCTEKEIEEMYLKKSLDTELLLKWSKLLKYDFFRLYSQHLLLYSPPEQKIITNNSQLPNFRKNLYTKEIIDYILEKIDTGNLSKQEIITRYRIPKTTLYKWISKYKK